MVSMVEVDTGSDSVKASVITIDSVTIDLCIDLALEKVLYSGAMDSAKAMDVSQHYTCQIMSGSFGCIRFITMFYTTGYPLNIMFFLLRVGFTYMYTIYIGSIISES